MRDRVLFSVESLLDIKKNALVEDTAKRIIYLMEDNVNAKLGIENISGMTVVKNNKCMQETISETLMICELLDKELFELQTRDKPKSS